jgi:hypothetical protein
MDSKSLVMMGVAERADLKESTTVGKDLTGGEVMKGRRGTLPGTVAPQNSAVDTWRGRVLERNTTTVAEESGAKERG